MALSNERLGELGLKALELKLVEDGVHLKPKEIKRQITNNAKQLGIPVHEAAEFTLHMIEKIYRRTEQELTYLIMFKNGGQG